MKHILTNTFIIIILLLCTHISFAQETKTSFKVRLDIIAEDKDTKQTIESYISRELRNLGDVTIVDTGEDCELGLIVFESKTLSGIKAGIAISVVYYEPQNVIELLYIQEEVYNLINLLITPPVTEQRQELIEKVSGLSLRIDNVFSGIGNYSAKKHLLYTGDIDDLRNRCEKIVVDFDNLYLKEKRKAIAEIKVIQ